MLQSVRNFARTTIPRIEGARDDLARRVPADVARSRIATMVVATILECAIALMVMSHAPSSAADFGSVPFILSLCLVFNAATVQVCRRAIFLAQVEPGAATP
mgnify:CR=1 FL=1